jgi:hypothetical protein
MKPIRARRARHAHADPLPALQPACAATFPPPDPMDFFAPNQHAKVREILDRASARAGKEAKAETSRLKKSIVEIQAELLRIQLQLKNL